MSFLARLFASLEDAEAADLHAVTDGDEASRLGRDLRKAEQILLLYETDFTRESPLWRSQNVYVQDLRRQFSARRAA